MNFQEAFTAWQADRAMHEARGISLPGVVAYLPDEFRHNFDLAMDSIPQLRMAMDAQPALQTTPNAGVPALFTTMVDPKIYKILFAPNMAAQIFGEEKAGSWVEETRLFPTVEHDGEVTSYGDFAESGHAGANANWPQRQVYRFQTIKEYGDLELDRAGAAKLNWVSELDEAAATVMKKFENLTYFFGVQGLQNYGLLNDPNLSASLTPALKAWGGTAWFNLGVVAATANEIFTDIQTLFSQLVKQTAGLVDAKTKMVLAMSPGSEVALTTTNTFNVNVYDLLKKNFPNIRFETAVQYGVQTTQNPQGIAAGNFVQLIAEELEGQDTGYCAYSEKMKGYPIIRGTSSYKQKTAGGVWGAIIRMPVAISSMLGV